MTSIPLGDNEAIYFAYGTLLELESMHKYCPTAESLGIYRLKDYCLDFKTCRPDPTVGGCTLAEALGNIMYGILYKMPVEERQNLDEASGLDKGLWAELEITLLDNDGNPVPANTYTIPNPSGPYVPPASYTRPILAGAKEIPLPPHYIEQLEATVRGESKN
jgi:hypothetical protein